MDHFYKSREAFNGNETHSVVLGNEPVIASYKTQHCHRRLTFCFKYLFPLFHIQKRTHADTLWGDVNSHMLFSKMSSDSIITLLHIYLKKVSLKKYFHNILCLVSHLAYGFAFVQLFPVVRFFKSKKLPDIRPDGALSVAAPVMFSLNCLPCGNLVARSRMTHETNAEDRGNGINLKIDLRIL